MSISVSIESSKKTAGAVLAAVTISDVSSSLRSLPDFVATALAPYIKGIDLAAVFKAVHFTGKSGQSCAHVANGIPLVFVGLGDLDKKAVDNMETLRRALGIGYNYLKATDVKEIMLCVPEPKPFGLAREVYVEQVTTLLHIASYQYVEFKKDKKTWSPKISFVGTEKKNLPSIENGTIIGEAMNMARTLSDTPPNHMYPQIMADKAKQIAKEYGLTYTVISQEEAREMGMGCFYSVAKGSEHEGKIVVLEYKAAKAAKKKPIALVGKGVCFDTGGISLKPSNYMTGMKYDMSGAAAVFASMQIIAQLKPSVSVVGVTPLVENMPSGHASKQDDVVIAMNGINVEIENTDAEGRLILSDALCHVQKKYDPAVIIDIATLTGSCAATFGPFFAGLMTRDEDLAKELTEIGFFVGDKVWPLPLSDEYKPAIESSVADISNSGSQTYKAGAITAALFLEHFIEKGRRWAHLDIAGTDSKIPGTTYLGKGATGTGIRVMVEFVRRFTTK